MTSERLPTAIEELRELEEIQRLKHRYLRLLDTKDWDRWRDLFTDDASFVVLEARGDVSKDVDAFLADLRERLHGTTTVHQAHQPELALTGPGTATGTWPMFDYVEYPSADDGERRGKRGWGHYVETYRKTAEGWRIASLRLDRIRQDPLAGRVEVQERPRLSDERLPETPLTAEQLVDLEAIRQLKARYYRYLDTKRWDEWRKVFSDTASFAVEALPDGLAGDSFVATVAHNHRATITIHQGHGPEIAFDGPDAARGVWALYDNVQRPADNERPSHLGWGHYEERYRRENGEWRIADLRLSYLRVDTFEPTDAEIGPHTQPPLDWLPAGGLPDATRLDDLFAIKRLKARYVRLLDAGEWDEWRGLFTDDLRIVGTNSGADGDGADAFVERVRRHLDGATTIHQLHMPEIRFTGADTARGIWAMGDYVEWPGETRRGSAGAGHYSEEYRRVDGEWRIASLKLTRLRVDRLAGAPLPAYQSWTQAADGTWRSPGSSLTPPAHDLLD